MRHAGTSDPHNVRCGIPFLGPQKNDGAKAGRAALDVLSMAMYFAIQSGGWMRELDKALADILEIRSQIAQGTSFRGYGPTTIAATGMIGLSTAALQLGRPDIFAGSATGFVWCWLAASLVCAIAVRVEMQGRSRRLHSHLADAMINQAIAQFMPAAAAALFLPLFLLRFAPEAIWLMPGLWQILVSLGIFASVHSLPRSMGLAGGWYFLRGFVCLLWAAAGHGLSPWMMGGPFFLGQMLMAAILHFSSQGSHEEG
jgi:hypothetical protein